MQPGALSIVVVGMNKERNPLSEFPPCTMGKRRKGNRQLRGVRADCLPMPCRYFRTLFNRAGYRRCVDPLLLVGGLVLISLYV